MPKEFGAAHLEEWQIIRVMQKAHRIAFHISNAKDETRFNVPVRGIHEKNSDS
jgi:hypothetical protein